MASWARVENDEVVGVYGKLPTVWNNISNFDALDSAEFHEHLLSLGWYPVTQNIPTYDTESQILDEPTYEFIDGVVYENFIVKSKNIIDYNSELYLNEWVKVRQKRDELMAQFEWRYTRHERQERLNVKTTDIIQELDKYMQELADITSQNDPFNIVWPEYNESVH